MHSFKKTFQSFFSGLGATQYLIVALVTFHTFLEPYNVFEYRDYVVANNVQLNKVMEFLVWHGGDLNNSIGLIILFDIVFFTISKNKLLALLISSGLTLWIFYLIEIVIASDPMDFPAALLGVVCYCVFRFTYPNNGQ